MRILRKLTDHIKMQASYITRPPYLRKVVHTSINGYELLTLANEDVGRQIINLGRYEARESILLSLSIRSTDICLDIGANVGYYTMLMSQRARDGQVHAFEPIPLNFHLLSAAIHMNNATNVVPNLCAVGDNEKEITFSQAADSAFSSIVPVGRRSEVASIRTRMVTLDGYMKRQGLNGANVVKIDVEGAEKVVIEGAGQLFSHPDTRPRLVLMELHGPSLAAYGTTVAEMVKTMTFYGYQACYPDKHGSPRPFEVEHYDYFYNVFFMQEAP